MNANVALIQGLQCKTSHLQVPKLGFSVMIFTCPNFNSGGIGPMNFMYSNLILRTGNKFKF